MFHTGDICAGVVRRLVPKAHKIRVESYDDSAVLAAVEDCDLVVYGIDQRRVVLDGRSLKFHLAAKPKHRIVIDFNSFGSTVHLDEVPEMTLWDIGRIENEVAQYAQSLCGDRPAYLRKISMSSSASAMAVVGVMASAPLGRRITPRRAPTVVSDWRHVRWRCAATEIDRASVVHIVRFCSQHLPPL